LGLNAERWPLVSAPAADFADLLGSRFPIVGAPMANAAGVELAVAVIEGGGVGSLPCALLTPDEALAQVREVRSRARGPLNLNFFCHEMRESVDDSEWRKLLEPYRNAFGAGPEAAEAPLRLPFDEPMCELVETVRPELVSFHFGLPDENLLGRVRAAGCRIVANATTIDEARALAVRGVDAIIAQGWEAGGHAGRFLSGKPEEHMGLFALLPQVVDATGLPVIAAGGIADARGIAAALLLGATAVQIGTAYLRSPESLIGPAHRAALDAVEAERTVFTNVYTGGLARGIRTRLIDDLGPIRPEAPQYPLAARALAPVAKSAKARGEAGFAPMWAGQAARLASALPARELTEALGRDALALLGRRA
jgi:nitronate monooxygenase